MLLRGENEPRHVFRKRRFCSRGCGVKVALKIRWAHKHAIASPAAPRPSPEDDAIAAHIATHGVTRCPPAAVGETSADLAAQPGREVIRAHDDALAAAHQPYRTPFPPPPKPTEAAA